MFDYLRRIQSRRMQLDGFCFTMDVDWASEFVLQQTLRSLEQLGIHPTVFVTHHSDCIAKYLLAKKIDAGIHPNFILPSSQGQTDQEIINYCMDLIPNPRALRCHRWFASNDIYDVFFKRGIVYESNICSLLDVVHPFLHRSGMLSFPVFLEDGAYLYHKLPLDFSCVQPLFSKKGLKVINIHPMHFLLNTPYFQYMRDIKDRLPRETWNQLDEDAIHELRNATAVGINDFLLSMLDFIQKKGTYIWQLDEVYKFLIQ